jgi:hypothetical protein
MIPPSIPDGLEAGLRDFDSGLRLDWNRQHNVWELQERGRRSGTWRYVFFWADDAGGGKWSYRPLPTSAGPILQRLAALDYERLGVLNQRDYFQIARNMESKRRDWLDNRRKEDSEARKAAMRDKYPFYMRGRRAFALNDTHVPG